jgi:ribonuclease HII
MGKVGTKNSEANFDFYDSEKLREENRQRFFKFVQRKSNNVCVGVFDLKNAYYSFDVAKFKEKCGNSAIECLITDFEKNFENNSFLILNGKKAARIQMDKVHLLPGCKASSIIFKLFEIFAVN